MDLFTLFIGICLLFTGALFFGYPLGLKHGAKMVADKVCRDLDAREPFLVRDARRRLDRRSSPPYEGGVAAASADGVVLSGDTVLNAEVIE